ncbi:hypothetical protein CDV36_010834 [Fusarium kuroshium]|uniref:Uncharacterized protein n=3 Tax=Fusarium solani species complex TaxID=232080 RepID=A0A3M2RX94_9HYPO|nr:hypothetical protein CDV36_010834 [Fusarium kuroshium]RSL84964.1 hypothetical protein CEP51_003581 [Fusarium floridanum]RSM07729.1 hypothetical protein CEP52_005043 [Fusarium oligoseptatum]
MRPRKYRFTLTCILDLTRTTDVPRSPSPASPPAIDVSLDNTPAMRTCSRLLRPELILELALICRNSVMDGWSAPDLRPLPDERTSTTGGTCTSPRELTQ